MGVVTGFFFYDGLPEDKGKPRSEIDIEFLGGDTTKMHVNYYTNNNQRLKFYDDSDPYGLRHIPDLSRDNSINLGFDASLEWHKYAIDWSKDTIKWSVDDHVVWTEDGITGWGSIGTTYPSLVSLPTPPGTIILNLYPNTKWAGELDYTGPIYAYFKDIKYSPG
jgi:beta-glucanase (GH16 family)